MKLNPLYLPHSVSPYFTLSILSTSLFPLRCNFSRGNRWLDLYACDFHFNSNYGHLYLKILYNELPFLLVNLKRCFNPDSIIFYSFDHSYENFVTNRRDRVSLFSESTRKWKKEMFSWINLPFRISSWSIITSLVTESTFSSLKFYKFTLPSKRNYSC